MPTPESQLLRDHLVLALVPGLGPRLTKALLAHFGSVDAIRAASVARLQQVPHIGSKTATAFHQALREVDVDAELERMRQQHVRVILRGTPEYPAALEQLDDAPYLLYVRGAILPADASAIAIVGSRQCTAYGRRMSELFAQGLVQAGYTIVSGLARGIDGFAHRAAVKAGGRTLAVLPGGLGNIYPPEHHELAEDIERAGALLSELPMLAEPQAGSFHARNRIISGLSRAVIIIEAGERSGALITANHAAEQGREVFGVPGPVDSPASVGVNQLLRQGVRLVRSVDDVLEDLRALGKAAPPKPNRQSPHRPPRLSPTKSQQSPRPSLSPLSPPSPASLSLPKRPLSLPRLIQPKRPQLPAPITLPRRRSTRHSTHRLITSANSSGKPWPLAHATSTIWSAT